MKHDRRSLLEKAERGGPFANFTRAIRASLRVQDEKEGRGAYHLTVADIRRLKGMLGPQFDEAMAGASFVPRPRHEGQWWTGPRTPSGMDVSRRLKPNWTLLAMAAAALR